MKAIQPIWLWAEADGVRLWTPETTGLHAGVRLNATAEQWRRLTRDGAAQIALEAVLEPATLVRALAQVLRSGQGRPVLHLVGDADLMTDQDAAGMAALQALPFEFLWLDGQPLASAGLTVARWVPPATAPLPPVTPGPICIADLWPRNPGKPHALTGLHDANSHSAAAIRILPGPAATCAFILHTAPSQFAALVLFGHGQEADGAPDPLLGPDGHPWELPLVNGLPPLVILLACGTEGGNLIDYGRALMRAGARAVLAPFGRLDQPQARRFLEVFLPRWMQGERLDLALNLAREQDDSGWGARRLVLLGDPGLRFAPEPQLCEREDQALAALSQTASDEAPVALGLLADRLTLRCFQRRQRLDKARQQLLEQLWIRRGEAAAERDLLRRLHQVYTQAAIGNLTRLWLAPWLAQLAEQHDHRRLTYYESQRQELLPVADLAPAIVYHDWGRVAYRRGRYAHALEDVVRGIQVLPSFQLLPEGAPLVRDLVNLLIEFNLPEAAQTVARHLDASLSAMSPSDALADERFKLTDTLARACLRGGDWQAALALWRRKREITLGGNKSDGRELAWLLYSSAWGHPEAADTLAFASITRERLRDQAAVCAAVDVEQGNSDSLYLLRAFAAWVWRAGSLADAELMLGYRDLLADGLHRRQDSGPSGFAIGYLNLPAWPSTAASGAAPDWSAARESLRQERYFLEAATFDALMGHSRQAAESLRLFQMQRMEFPVTLKRLSSKHMAMESLGLSSEVLSDWADEANGRAQLEIEWLTQRSPSAADLLRLGLLPM